MLEYCWISLPLQHIINKGFISKKMGKEFKIRIAQSIPDQQILEGKNVSQLLFKF